MNGTRRATTNTEAAKVTDAPDGNERGSGDRRGVNGGTAAEAGAGYYMKGVA